MNEADRTRLSAMSVEGGGIPASDEKAFPPRRVTKGSQWRRRLIGTIWIM